jgi:hypothetical protein
VLAAEGTDHETSVSYGYDPDPARCFEHVDGRSRGLVDKDGQAAFGIEEGDLERRGRVAFPGVVHVAAGPRRGEPA